MFSDIRQNVKQKSSQLAGIAAVLGTGFTFISVCFTEMENGAVLEFRCSSEAARGPPPVKTQ